MSTDNQPKAHGPPLDRRTFLRAAGAGAGAVATGAGAQQVGLSPVGEAEALTKSEMARGAAVGAFGIPAAAGVGIYNYAVEGDTDIDTSDTLEDQLYNAALAVAQGRESYEEQLTAEYLDPPQGESAYASAVWSTIRSVATKELVNGNGTSGAQSAAQDAIEKQTTIALWNVTEHWNTGLIALSDGIQTDISENVGVFALDQDNSDFASGSGFGGGFSPAFSVESPMIYERDFSGPMDPSTIEGMPDNPTEYGLGYSGDSNDYMLEANMWVREETNYKKILATHSGNLSTQVVFDTGIYQDVTQRIVDEYNSILSDLTTFVESLASGLDQGAINAEEVYTPTDLVDQFASSDKRSRTAIELAAAGAEIPDSLSYEALISHPDLKADELWVDLFPQFTGDAIDIAPGVTLASADYSVAVIGYVSGATDEYERDVLSGDSDLQIIDVAGVEGEQDATASAPDTADSAGDINLGTDPPDEVQNPGDYDDSFNVVVTTEAGDTYTAPVADVTQVESGEYIVPASSTGLSGGETISSVRIVPVVGTEQPTQYVADPTSVDSQKVQDLIKSQSQLVETVKQMDGGSGSGFLGGGNLFSAGRGMVGGVILAVLAIFTLSTLN